MKKPILQKGFILTLTLIAGYLGFGQSISAPAMDATEPYKASFTLTNGNGSTQHFTTNTNYKFEIRNTTNPDPDAWEDLNAFSVVSPPIGNANSSTHEKNIIVPMGNPDFTAGNNYKLRISATRSGVFSNKKSPTTDLTLVNDLSIDTTATGYIKCQTPAVTYKLITLRNTGNITDKYNLSLNQNIQPQTEQDLLSQIMDVETNTISTTPALIPGESYTFMIRFDAPPGTTPDQDNYTGIIATSQNDPSISFEEEIHTYVYCGSGNNNPDLPDAPDLSLTKTAPGAATVGEPFDYSITIQNSTSKKAINPTISDSIPSNLKVLNYYTNDSRNIIFNYEESTQTLEATFITNNQQTFINSDDPITIYINVVANCDVDETTENTAYVFNGAGDVNDSNDIDTATTSISLDFSNPEVGTWTGDESTNWYDCKNWKKGVVPDATIDVTIPTSAENNPIIDSDLAPDSSTPAVKSITIKDSKNVSLVNSDFEVGGNWTNYGTFTPNGNTVIFNGNENNEYQVITDENTDSFYNLKVDVTDGALGIQIPDNFPLFVMNAIDLNAGNLRLEGKAQLIQTHTGSNPNSGTGKLLRDQQGHANPYNYNYWSSPVGNSTSAYTIAGQMKDGSDAESPEDIQWVGGTTPTFTNPISIAKRWLYKFESTGPDYANWGKITQSETLEPGVGYTMKGSANLDGSGLQNYTFEGLPFSGDIEKQISEEQISLLGNPYASALDANQFIEDNEGVIDGYIEFWDHFETTNSHNLDHYMGGYAKYNLTDQIAAVNLSNNTSSRTPKQFIPVGQGFFVSAAAGISPYSTITFNNAQRAFVKEDDSDGMALYGIPSQANSHSVPNKGHIKIKLDMITPENYSHQIALGFMEDKASKEIDYGYDAKLKDKDPNQFYFMHPEAKLVIQGEGHFNQENTYPLGVEAEVNGTYTFEASQFTNLQESIPLYLYDNKKQLYYNLKKGPYEAYLTKGEHHSRFSLHFKNKEQENNANVEELFQQIKIYQQSNNVVLLNPSEQISIQNVTLHNTLGQQVTNWKIGNGKDNHIELPLPALATGIYYVKVQTDKGSTSKKVSIK